MKDIEQDIQEAIVNIFKARAEVVKVTKGKRRVAGSIKCPICATGDLSYTVAGNGHIHGQCSKDGCVSWME